MSKTISEIYKEYKIMPRLEMHMLRVAAVATLICDNFNEPLPKDDIVAACLLHDMGNIVKADLHYFSDLNEPEVFKYWEKVQNIFFEKYGKDDHQATMKIIREISVTEKVFNLIDGVDFSNLCRQRDQSDFSTKIINYVDGRVDPNGVVSYDERMEEAKKRYKDREHLFPVENRDKLIACGKEIEKQIFAKCKIKPEDINDETVEPIISELRDFVIK